MAEVLERTKTASTAAPAGSTSAARPDRTRGVQVQRKSTSRTSQAYKTLEKTAKDPLGQKRRQQEVDRLKQIAADPRNKKIIDPTVSSQTPGRPTVSDSANQRYAQAGLSGQYEAGRVVRGKQDPQQQYVADQTRNSQVVYTNRPRVKKKKSIVRKLGGVKATVAMAAIRKAKVTAANSVVFPIATLMYFTFQLPFALISSAGLGMAFAAYSYLTSVLGEGITQTLINGITIIATSSTTAAQVIGNIANALFGITFDPFTVFGFGLIAVFIFGILQIAIALAIYMPLGIKCLGGKSSGMKWVLFGFACFGMFIPFLNLLPWVLFWVGFVWLRPR